MKKIKLLILLLSLICLTGCSKNDPNAPITLKWKDGAVTFGGDQIYFTEYTGNECVIEAGQGGYKWVLRIEDAKDVTTLPSNSMGILEENMDTFKKKFYYTQYLGTQFTMASSIGDDMWAVCETIIERETNAATIAAYASDYIDMIPLTYNQVYVDFGGFIFGTEYDTVKVRPDCALISGIIKVSADPHDCTEPYTVIQDEKEYQLMKSSGAKYDYYTYDGFTIQIAAGLNISDYIKFK